jgi:lipid A 3-O-deacylase
MNRLGSGLLMRAATCSGIRVGLVGLVALGATAAAAADLGPRPTIAPDVQSPPLLRPSLWEIRVGGSAQDLSGPESGSFNVNGELLLPKFVTVPDAVLNLFIPRAHVGGSLNTRGDTSYAYAGLTWTFDVTPQFFVEASFGGAVHDGNTDRVIVAPHEAALGCSPLFRESASAGFRFTQNWSVMATVEHLSNAGLCSQNRGLTNVGVRLGYTF